MLASNILSYFLLWVASVDHYNIVVPHVCVHKYWQMCCGQWLKLWHYTAASEETWRVSDVTPKLRHTVALVKSYFTIRESNRHNEVGSTAASEEFQVLNFQRGFMSPTLVAWVSPGIQGRNWPRKTVITPPHPVLLLVSLWRRQHMARATDYGCWSCKDNLN